MPTPAVRDRRAALALVATGLLAACSGSAISSEAVTTTSEPTAVTSVVTTSTTTSTTSTSTTSTTSTTTTSTSTTSTSTTSTTSTSTTSTTSTTTEPPPTVPTIPPLPPIAAIDALSFPVDTEVEIGRSVEGRPITVIRRGTPGGTRVLAVGAIHGNEDAGVAIIDRLASEPLPEGIELWLVRSMNPDGQARQDRQNSNAVDLNRNFPHNWDYLGVEGDWQYGGTGPASEPETQAMVALGDSVRPDLIFWYHQDLFRISPSSGRNGAARARYAEISGLPLVEVSGGTYTGTASQWSRTVAPDDGIGMTIELGPTLTETETVDHVAAVFAVATEFF
jgi:protein MpaA